MRYLLLLLALLALGWGFWALSGGSDFEPPLGEAESPLPASEEAAATESPGDPAAPPEEAVAAAPEPAPEDPADAPPAPEAAAMPDDPVEPPPEVLPDPAGEPEPDEPRPLLPDEPLDPSDALAALAPELATPASPPVRTAPRPPAGEVPEPDAAEPGAPETPAPDSAPEAEAPAEPDRRRITADRVNLREGPGTGFPSQGLLDEGDEVEVLEQDGDWLRVRTEAGTEGWVSAEFAAPEEG